MLKNLSTKMASTLGTQLHSNRDDMAIYAYGMEILLCSVSKLLLLFIIASILNILVPTIFTFIAFAGFRVFGGGAHLQTYSRCLVVGLSTLLILAKLSTVIPVNCFSLFTAIFLVSLLAIAAIINWVPAGTDKKRITNPQDIARQKRKTGVFLVIWLVAIILLLNNGYLCYSLALVLGAAGGLFLVTPLGYKFYLTLDHILNDKKEVNN